MKLNLRNPLCIFDIETTGINVTQDRIIEIAIIKLMPNGEMLRKSNVLNPTIPIPAESTVFHGLTDADVKDKPTFKEVAKEYARFLEGADLAGFAVLKLDIPMLVEEFIRAGVDFDYSKKKIIDAQKIFHLMEKRTLGAAYKFYLDKPFTNSHSAESDTEATLEVLMAQVVRYDGQPITDLQDRKIGEVKNDMEVLSKLTCSDLVDLAGRMTRNGKGEEVFNFGKHKNKAVTQVFKQEPAYYDWMMNGDFPLDTKRKLTEIKLRGFKK
ncbi:MAG TPA: 3'-5' exonuclease [Ohtaekwangia sp.]|nr:3'-5' exonuclease [Ohtaekwangia sp.]